MSVALQCQEGFLTLETETEFIARRPTTSNACKGQLDQEKRTIPHAFIMSKSPLEGQLVGSSQSSFSAAPWLCPFPTCCLPAPSECVPPSPAPWLSAPMYHNQSHWLCSGPQRLQIICKDKISLLFCQVGMLLLPGLLLKNGEKGIASQRCAALLVTLLFVIAQH